MNIPKDPVMLVSFLNMKLRDFYGSLEELADDLELDAQTLKEQAAAAGFEYDEKKKRFL